MIRKYTRLEHFSINGVFFSKIRRKTEKIHMYSDKMTNQFWLSKSYVTGFFLTNFFHSFVNNIRASLICKINVHSTSSEWLIFLLTYETFSPVRKLETKEKRCWGSDFTCLAVAGSCGSLFQRQKDKFTR